MDEYDPESPTDETENAKPSAGVGPSGDFPVKLPSILDVPIDVPITERWTPLESSVLDEGGYRKPKKKKKKKKKGDGNQESEMEIPESLVKEIPDIRDLPEPPPPRQGFGPPHGFGNHSDGQGFHNQHGFDDRSQGFDNRNFNDGDNFEDHGRGGRGGMEFRRNGRGRNSRFDDDNGFRGRGHAHGRGSFDEEEEGGYEEGGYNASQTFEEQPGFNGNFNGPPGFNPDMNINGAQQQQLQFQPRFNQFGAPNPMNFMPQQMNPNGGQPQPFSSNFQGPPGTPFPPGQPGMSIPPNMPTPQGMPGQPPMPNQPAMSVPSGMPGQPPMSVPTGMPHMQPGMSPLMPRFPPPQPGMDQQTFMQAYVQQAMLAQQQQQQQQQQFQSTPATSQPSVPITISQPHISAAPVALAQIQLPPPPPDTQTAQIYEQLEMSSKKSKKKSRKKGKGASAQATMDMSNILDPNIPTPPKGTGEEPIEIDDSPPHVVVIDEPEEINLEKEENKEETSKIEEQEEPSAARKLLQKVLKATRSGAKQLPDLNQLPPMIGKGLLSSKSKPLAPKISFQVKTTSKTVDGSGGESDEEQAKKEEEAKKDLLKDRPKMAKKEIFKPDKDKSDPTIQHLVKIRDDMELQEKIQKEEFKVILATLNQQTTNRDIEIPDMTNTATEQKKSSKKSSRWSDSAEPLNSVVLPDNPELVGKWADDYTDKESSTIKEHGEQNKENERSSSREKKSASKEHTQIEIDSPERSKSLEKSKDNSTERSKHKDQEIGKSKDRPKERSMERSHDKSKNKSRDHSSDKHKERSRDRSKEKNRDRRHDRKRDRSRDGRNRGRSYERSRDKYRDRSNDRSKGRSRDRSKGRSRDRSKGRSRERSKGRERSRGRSRDRSRGRSRDRSKDHSREHSKGQLRHSRSHSVERPSRRRKKSLSKSGSEERPFKGHSSPGIYYEDERGYYWSATNTPWYKLRKEGGGWKHHPGYFYKTDYQVTKKAIDDAEPEKSRSGSKSRRKSDSRQRRSESISPSPRGRKKRDKKGDSSDSSSSDTSSQDSDTEKEKNISKKKVVKKKKQQNDSSDSDYEFENEKKTKKTSSKKQKDPTPEKSKKSATRRVQKISISSEHSSDSSEDSSDSSSDSEDEKTKKSAKKRQFLEDKSKSRDEPVKKQKRKNNSEEDLPKSTKSRHDSKGSEKDRKRHDTSSDDSSEDNRKKRKQKEKSSRKEKRRNKSETSSSETSSDEKTRNKRSTKEKRSPQRKQDSHKKEKSSERSKRKHSGGERREETEHMETEDTEATTHRFSKKSSEKTPQLEIKITKPVEPENKSSTDDEDDDDSDEDDSSDSDSSNSYVGDEKIDKQKKSATLSTVGKEKVKTSKSHKHQEEKEDHKTAGKKKKSRDDKVENPNHKQKDHHKTDSKEKVSHYTEDMSGKKRRGSLEAEEKEKSFRNESKRERRGSKDSSFKKFVDGNTDDQASSKRSRHQRASVEDLYDPEEGFEEVEVKKPRKLSPDIHTEKLIKGKQTSEKEQESFEDDSQNSKKSSHKQRDSVLKEVIKSSRQPEEETRLKTGDIHGSHSDKKHKQKKGTHSDEPNYDTSEKHKEKSDRLYNKIGKDEDTCSKEKSKAEQTIDDNDKSPVSKEKHNKHKTRKLKNDMESPDKHHQHMDDCDDYDHDEHKLSKKQHKKHKKHNKKDHYSEGSDAEQSSLNRSNDKSSDHDSKKSGESQSKHKKDSHSQKIEQEAILKQNKTSSKTDDRHADTESNVSTKSKKSSISEEKFYKHREDDDSKSSQIKPRRRYSDENRERLIDEPYKQRNRYGDENRQRIQDEPNNSRRHSDEFRQRDILDDTDRRSKRSYKEHGEDLESNRHRHDHVRKEELDPRHPDNFSDTVSKISSRRHSDEGFDDERWHRRREYSENYQEPRKDYDRPRERRPHYEETIVDIPLPPRRRSFEEPRYEGRRSYEYPRDYDDFDYPQSKWDRPEAEYEQGFRRDREIPPPEEYPRIREFDDGPYRIVSDHPELLDYSPERDIQDRRADRSPGFGRERGRDFREREFLDKNSRDNRSKHIDDLSRRNEFTKSIEEIPRLMDVNIEPISEHSKFQHEPLRHPDDSQKHRLDPPRHREEHSRHREEPIRNREEPIRHREEPIRHRDESLRHKDELPKHKDEVPRHRDDHSRQRDEYPRHRDDFVRHKEEDIKYKAEAPGYKKDHSGFQDASPRSRDGRQRYRQEPSEETEDIHRQLSDQQHTTRKEDNENAYQKTRGSGKDAVLKKEKDQKLSAAEAEIDYYTGKKNVTKTAADLKKQEAHQDDLSKYISKEKPYDIKEKKTHSIVDTLLSIQKDVHKGTEHKLDILEREAALAKPVKRGEIFSSLGLLNDDKPKIDSNKQRRKFTDSADEQLLKTTGTAISTVSSSQSNVTNLNSSLSWLHSYDDFTSDSDKDKLQSPMKISSTNLRGFRDSGASTPATTVTDYDSCYDEVTSSDSEFKKQPNIREPIIKKSLQVHLERLSDDNKKGTVSLGTTEDKSAYSTEELSLSESMINVFETSDIPLPASEQDDEKDPPPPPPPPPQVEPAQDSKNKSSVRRSRRISARISSADSMDSSEVLNSSVDSQEIVKMDHSTPRPKITLKLASKLDKNVLEAFSADIEPIKPTLEKHTFDDILESTPKESTDESSQKEDSTPKMRRSSRRSAQAANEALVNLNNNASRRGRVKKAVIPDNLSKEESVIETTSSTQDSSTVDAPVSTIPVLGSSSQSVSAVVTEHNKIFDAFVISTPEPVKKIDSDISLIDAVEKEITDQILQEESNKKKSKSDSYDRDEDRRDRDRRDPDRRDPDRRDDRRDRRDRYYDDERDRYRSSDKDRDYDRDRDYDDRRYRDRGRRDRDRSRDDYYRERDRSFRDREDRDYDKRSRRRYDTRSRSRSPDYETRRSTKDDTSKTRTEMPTFDPPKKTVPQELFKSDASVKPHFTSSVNPILTVVPTHAADSSTQSPPKPLKVKSRWLRFSEAEASQDVTPPSEEFNRQSSNLVSLTRSQVPPPNLNSNLVSIVPVEILPQDVPLPPQPVSTIPVPSGPVPSTYRPPPPDPPAASVTSTKPSDPHIPVYIDQLLTERELSPQKTAANIFDILNKVQEIDLKVAVSSTVEVPQISNTVIDDVPPPPEEMKVDEEPAEIPYFEPIEENLYLTERRQSKEMRRMVCDCTTCKEDREMGTEACGNDCLNRMLYIECGSRCACGDYCTNKRFQNQRFSNVEAFQTSWKGFGLRAVEDLEPDVFVMEYVGEVMDYRGFKSRSKQYARDSQKHFYFMALNPDVLIDATLKGNISRFINHSCDPNCETQKWTVNGELRIGFFTKKVIAVGEELTFNYQFETYGQAAQKCFCGSENCRGVIGIEKPAPFKTKKKDKSKKKEDSFGVVEIEEQIERMTVEGLRNKNHVLNLCRLMVYVQETDHKIAILNILQNTPEPACLRLFVEYHGLPLLWSWMADSMEPSTEFQLQVVALLVELPITNKTILQDSKILSVIEKWTEASESENTTELPPVPADFIPVPAADAPVPVGILTTPKDTKEMKEKARKKRVTFAEEEPSSDSELSDIIDRSSSEASASTNFMSERKSMDLSAEGKALRLGLENLEESDLVQSSENIEADSSMDTDKTFTESSATEEESQDEESSSDSHAERPSVSSVASKLLEHWSTLKEIFKIPRKERVEERKRTERELDTRYQEIGDSPWSEWSTKRKKKGKKRGGPDEEVLLDPNRPRKTLLPTPPKMSKEERRQLFEAQVKAQDEMNAEFQRQQLETLKATYPLVPIEYFTDPGFLTAVQTNPNFAMQLHDPNFIMKLQDPTFMMQFQEPNALEDQDMNLIMQMQQDPSLILQLQQDPNLLLQLLQQDPNLLLMLQQDPNLLLQIQQNPALILQLQQNQNMPMQMQMHHDPNMVPPGQMPLPGMPTQVVDINGQIIQTGLPPQPEVIPQQPQVIVDASGQQILIQQPYQVQPQQPQFYSVQQPGIVIQAPPPVTPTVPQTLQIPDHNLVQQQLQQLINLQQTIAASTPSTSQLEEDVPPPPSPPKAKQPKLPPNWKTAKDAEGKTYFYHSITRITQWDAPTWDQGDVPDMDLGTPTFDEFGKKKKKTTTAAADTSSEVEKKLKDYFRKGMSTYIVSCLNPYRKNDCKLGKITSTEDFKHLARKLTHHVMAKELKHCRHVEDLEVNENVKSKAKDYVRKYMSKSGQVYKKPLDDDIY